MTNCIIAECLAAIKHCLGFISACHTSDLCELSVHLQQFLGPFLFSSCSYGKVWRLKYLKQCCRSVLFSRSTFLCTKNNLKNILLFFFLKVQWNLILNNKIILQKMLYFILFTENQNQSCFLLRISGLQEDNSYRMQQDLLCFLNKSILLCLLIHSFCIAGWTSVSAESLTPLWNALCLGQD